MIPFSLLKKKTNKWPSSWSECNSLIFLWTTNEQGIQSCSVIIIFMNGNILFIGWTHKTKSHLTRQLTKCLKFCDLEATFLNECDRAGYGQPYRTLIFLIIKNWLMIWIQTYSWKIGAKKNFFTYFDLVPHVVKWKIIVFLNTFWDQNSMESLLWKQLTNWICFLTYIR